MNPKSLLEEVPIDTKNLLDFVKQMWMVGMKDSHNWMLDEEADKTDKGYRKVASSL